MFRSQLLEQPGDDVCVIVGVLFGLTVSDRVELAKEPHFL